MNKYEQEIIEYFNEIPEEYIKSISVTEFRNFVGQRASSEQLVNNYNNALDDLITQGKVLINKDEEGKELGYYLPE